jgi:hypothetical protein
LFAVLSKSNPHSLDPAPAVLFCLLSITITLAAAAPSAGFFPPTNNLRVPSCANPAIHNVSLYYSALEADKAMPAQVGAQRVGVPFKTLVNFVGNNVNAWPTWNRCVCVFAFRRIWVDIRARAWVSFVGFRRIVRVFKIAQPLPNQPLHVRERVDDKSLRPI